MAHRSHHIRLVGQLCEQVHTDSELTVPTQTAYIWPIETKAIVYRTELLKEKLLLKKPLLRKRERKTPEMKSDIYPN